MMMKRVLSFVMAVVLCLQMLPAGVLAAEADTGLCEHHTAHDAACGYAGASPAAVCTHGAHTEGCYQTVCSHVCGEGCAVDTPCTFQCTGAADCLTTVLACGHKEDGSCCARAETAAQACGFQCTDCAAQEQSNPIALTLEGPAPMAASTTGFYVVAGEAGLCGSVWDFQDVNNLMTQNSDGTYSKVFSNVAPGTYAFKVCLNESEEVWHWYGDASGNNIQIKVSKDTELTIRFDPASEKVTFSGEGVSLNTSLDIDFMTAVGDGSGSWLNGAMWDPGDWSNQMTEISDGVYSIRYTGVTRYTDHEFKFAANGSWSDNWGSNEYQAESGKTYDAVYDGGNIYLSIPYDKAAVTLTLDLSGYNAADKSGATFTVLVEEDTHQWSEAWTSDGEGHWHSCSHCEEKEAYAAHTPSADDGDCTTAVTCTVCGYEVTPAKEHSFTDAADTSCDNEGCGYTRSVHSHDGLDFTAWTATDRLPTEAGNYCLEADVILDSAWKPAGSTSLCLNGHSIAQQTWVPCIIVNSGVTLDIYDCGTSGKLTHTEGNRGRGAKIVGGTLTLHSGSICGNTGSTADTSGGGVYIESGSFTMKGGSIAGNAAAASKIGYGGGVAVASGAVFTMEGGSISGNDALSSGGGVYNEGTFKMTGGSITGNTSVIGGGVSNSGSFTMTGGSITGNAATEAIGGVAQIGAMTVSGSAKITGNAVKAEGAAAGTASNVGLISAVSYLTVGELGTGASIGISCLDTSFSPTSGAISDAPASAYASYFTADDSGYAVTADGDGNLVLTAHTHQWSGQWTWDGTSHWHECTAEGCDGAKGSVGPHSLDAEGVCGTCGWACAHETVSSEGVCGTCGKQYALSLTMGGETDWYDDLSVAGELMDAGTAEDPIKIKLFKDVESGKFRISKSFVVLDLNGKTLRVNGSYIYVGNSTLTIRDSSQEGTGVCEAEGYINLMASGMTLESGKIIGFGGQYESDPVIKMAAKSTLVQNGGWIEVPANVYSYCVVRVTDGSTFTQNAGTLKNSEYGMVQLSGSGSSYILNDGSTICGNTYSGTGCIVDMSASTTAQINGGEHRVNGIGSMVSSGATLTVTGGTFKSASGSAVETGDIEAGAAVQISGGIFEEGLKASVYLEQTLAQLLAPGYVFYDEEGKVIPLTGGQTEISGYAKVGECVHSLEYTTADGHHTRACANCGLVTEENVECTPADADDSCLTAEICACGAVLTAANESHSLEIKSDKDETHHILACANQGCRYEEEGLHEFQELASADCLVSEATCVSGKTYYKSCQCGRRSNETFESGEVDETAHSYVYNVRQLPVLQSITQTCSHGCSHRAEVVLAKSSAAVYTGSPITSGLVRLSVSGTFGGCDDPTEEDLVYYQDGKVVTEVIYPGTYTASLTLGGETISMEASVSKAIPEYTIPTGLTATYGQTLADVALPEGWDWALSETSVGDVGEKTFLAIFTPAEPEFYRNGNEYVTVTVGKAILSDVSVTQEGSLTYTGSPQTAQVQPSAAAIGGQSVTFTYSTAPEGDYTGAVPAFTDAGEYTVYFKADANSHETASGSFTVTIEKAIPALGAVTLASSDAVYQVYKPEDIGLSREHEDVAGTLALDAGQTLTVGTGEYSWTFTPADTANYSLVTGKISITVIQDSLAEITIAGVPDKTAYSYGEELDLTGVTVTAVYASGLTADVTGSVSIPALAVGQTSVTLSYTEKGVTKTCELSGLTVGKKQLDVSCIVWDTSASPFTYDGTAKSVSLTGLLPELTAEQSGHTATEPGSYTAAAAFKLAEGYSADNYEIVGDTTLTADWVIGKASQTALSLGSVSGKVYGSEPFTLSASGGSTTAEVTFESSDESILSISGSTATIHKPGTVTITARKAGDQHYQDVSAIRSITIGRAALTVRADDRKMALNGTVPKLTCTVTGLVGADTFTAPRLEAPDLDTSAIGDYEIIVSGGTLSTGADYYDVTYEKGTLSVVWWEYEITKGADQTVRKGNTASFTSNAAYRLFDEVHVDGKRISSASYSVKSGSTVVTLKASYIKTLSLGKHTLIVVSDNGEASTTFTVKAASDSDTPRTGDITHSSLWLSLALVGLAGLTASIAAKKRCAKRR